VKIQFNSSLDYQIEAIKAVTKLFEGQPIAQSVHSIAITNSDFFGISQNELSIANKFFLEKDDEIENWLLMNTRKIQESNQITRVDKLLGRNFSIEMETGTGKTYVYLRTIFELNKIYGFKKFIIVVPSIAIRQGVITSLRLMREHFETLYKEPYESTLYDSKDLIKVKNFATSNNIQIMVLNIQSFQRSENIMNQVTDDLEGEIPIKLLQSTRPIVIVDEPQNMETEISSQAINKLNFLCTLRYSATHKNPYNLIYKLDPITAYNLKLVKQIEVASVIADKNFNDAFIELKQINNKSDLKAQVLINISIDKNIQQKNIWVKRDDDLFFKSGNRDEYKNGFVVEGISLYPGQEHIKFTNGITIKKGEAIGNFNKEISKAQILETVKQHFEKVKYLSGKEVKVLSLFFIDTVSDYRVYNSDGTYNLGEVGTWFEEAYKNLQKDKLFKNILPHDVSLVHGGYFSKDKKGQFKNSNDRENIDDIDTYSLIMNDKEKLLSINEPLQFIFSHSALREGWDNPNVFQICTLRKTGSENQRRQTIGRGLRLPINKDGYRIHDDSINRLTVIANESYDKFARELQTEYEIDYGIKFSTVPITAFSKLILKAENQVSELQEKGSKEIWDILFKSGYIDEEGKVLDKFDINIPNFKLNLPEKYELINDQIIEIINQYIFKNRVVDSRKKINLKYNKKIELDSEFEEMWKEISQKTSFSVKFDTSKLIDYAIQRFKSNLQESGGKIKPLKIQIDITNIDQAPSGIIAGAIRETSSSNIGKPNRLPDILSYLQNETQLTRTTLLKILIKSGRLDEFLINPQSFLTMAVNVINKALNDLILEGIEYQKISGTFWEMSELSKDAEKGIIRYLNNLYKIKNENKSPYDYIEFGSLVEKTFAQSLDSNERVKFFIKLPNWFKIDTPIGTYNPDWAFYLKDLKKLYFIRETKSTLDPEDRKKSENMKIKFGEKHFKALNKDNKRINFGVATSLSDILLNL